jgi:hypothetical protein
LFTYEIRKQNGNRSQAVTIPSPDKADKEGLLKKHFLRFWGDVGQMVAFKKPKKVKQQWKVVEINTNVDEIHWSNDGWIPNYIKLEGEVKQRDGTTKLITCWTCENKLKPVGVQNGRQIGPSRKNERT